MMASDCKIELETEETKLLYAEKVKGELINVFQEMINQLRLVTQLFTMPMLLYTTVNFKFFSFRPWIWQNCYSNKILHNPRPE